MCFFYFVEQYYGIGMAAHTFCELSAFFISYIAGRCSDQTRHAEFFHVFAHVDADKRFGGVEQIFSQFFCQMGFTHTCRSEEHECAYGFVWIFESEPVALYGLYYLLDCGILSYYCASEAGTHGDQTFAFGLCYSLNGYSCHHGHYFGDTFGVDDLTVLGHIVLPCCALLIQFARNVICLIAQTRCTGKIVGVGCFLLFSGQAAVLFFEAVDGFRHIYICYAGT